MCGLGVVVVVVSPRKQESCQATSIIWDFHIEPQLRVMGAGQDTGPGAESPGSRPSLSS